MPPQLPPGTCPSRDKELIPFSCSLLCGSAFPGTTRPPCLGKQGGRKTSQSYTLGFQHSSALCLGVFLEPRRPHLELELTIIPPWEGRRHQTRPHTESTSAVPECPHCALEGRDRQSRPHSDPGLPLQCSSSCPGRRAWSLRDAGGGGSNTQSPGPLLLSPFSLSDKTASILFCLVLF